MNIAQIHFVSRHGFLYLDCFDASDFAKLSVTRGGIRKDTVFQEAYEEGTPH